VTEGREADERTIERLRRALAERDRENAELRRQLAEQAQQIAELQRRLALREQNSTVTSKPPSSDGLAGQPRERGRRTKSRRRRGGQPGHPGHWRELVPTDRVQTVITVTPPACQHCAQPLTATDATGAVVRHQVTELPPITAHVTEYRCQRCRCGACGHTTVAALPDDSSAISSGRS
jgi:transposase